MGSTNISEITEITNKTSERYFMYVWDNEHEGRYTPYGQDKWHYPEDGEWLEIAANAHLRADDCGIPDGGKSAGMDRVRVLFKASGSERNKKGDPGRGLRVNRVGLHDGMDQLVFCNHATGETIGSIDIPTSMHQNLLLVIDAKGIRFEQKEAVKSGEAKSAEEWERVRTFFENVAEIAKNVTELMAETA